MDLGIAGRVCVIAGGDHGVGLAAARLLRGEGARVLLVGADAAALADAAEGLDGGEDEVATLPVGPTERDRGEQMLGAATEAFGGVDALVNAPSACAGGAAKSSGAAWREQFELGVMAPLRAMRAFVPVLAERGWGRVVNVCTSAGGRPGEAVDAFSVAGAAGLALSRLFADRHVRQGVLVNAVCRPPKEGGDGPGTTAGAREIAFLCSERASYVAGAIWPAAADRVTR